MDTRNRPAPPKATTAERPDRKQAILLAAEKLFAQRGYHAVSLRQIAEEASVPLALVGYYYGQKHELFHAIFAHWSGTIAERLAALRAVLAEPHDAGKLQRIIEAFIGPVIRLRASAEGEYYALLMTQGLSTQQDEADRILREFFDPMAQAFVEGLHRTLAAEVPGVTRGEVAWCYQFALGALLHHLNDSRVERLSGGANQPNDAQAAPLLVRFIVHGIRGVVATRPAPAKPSRKTPRRPA